MKSYKNQIITREKLEEIFNENNSMRTIVKIEYNNKRGTAYRLENIKEFKSGDIIVLWENGEQTKLPEKIKYIIRHLIRK